MSSETWGTNPLTVCALGSWALGTTEEKVDWLNTNKHTQWNQKSVLTVQTWLTLCSGAWLWVACLYRDGSASCSTSGLWVGVQICIKTAHSPLPHTTIAASSTLQRPDREMLNNVEIKRDTYFSVCCFVSPTSPYSVTCHVTCVWQAGLRQVWTEGGFVSPLQAWSARWLPPSPTQITSLVCWPSPQVTEHWPRY